MSSADFVHPFSTKDLLTIPQDRERRNSVWQGFKLDTQVQSQTFALVDTCRSKLDQLDSKVLPLSLVDVPLSDIKSSLPSLSTGTGGPGAQPPFQSEDDNHSVGNLWDQINTNDFVQQNKVISWDHFLDDLHDEPLPIHLHEQKITIYNAVMRKHGSTKMGQSLRYALQDVFLNALLSLIIAQGSAFFAWDEKSFKFQLRMDDFTLSGYSQKAIRHLTEEFLSAGTKFRRILLSIEDTEPRCATQIAIAGSVRQILNGVSNHVTALANSQVTPVILKASTAPAMALVSSLYDMALILRGKRQDDEIVTVLVPDVEKKIIQFPGLQAIFNEVLVRALYPAFTSLHVQSAFSNSAAPSSPIISFGKLLPEDLLQKVSETRSSLQLLSEMAPSSAIFRHAKSNLHFTLAYANDDIVKIRRDAAAYETEGRNRILGPNSLVKHPDIASSSPATVPTLQSLKNDQPFRLNLELFKPQELSSKTKGQEDDLYEHVLLALRGRAPVEVLALLPLEALKWSLEPILSVQHRLASYSLLRVLFLEENLLSHLDLQYKFQLLGDGIFSSRLKQALFDTDQASGEGRRQTGPTAGLRLQSRQTWPPASSELRLVLMDILSRSIDNSQSDALQETLSFAIRDLPEEELERCRDPKSIHALDFLCLAYKAPSVGLEAVISPESIRLYTQIFNQSLLLLRMQTLSESLLFNTGGRRASGSLPPIYHRLVICVHHFVRALVDHARTRAIGLCWKRFYNDLRLVRDRLKAGQYEEVLHIVESVRQLRKRHEDTLKAILEGMLLLNEQHMLKQMIDGMFSVTLQLAVIGRKSEAELDIECRELYEQACVTARKFLDLLQKDAEDGRTSSPETLRELIDRVDLFDYYRTQNHERYG